MKAVKQNNEALDPISLEVKGDKLQEKSYCYTFTLSYAGNVIVQKVATTVSPLDFRNEQLSYAMFEVPNNPLRFHIEPSEVDMLYPFVLTKTGGHFAYKDAESSGSHFTSASRSRMCW